MFIIDLHYISPLEEIDNHMKEHMEFLNKYYASGTFIMSGRKKPRTGGIIIAAGDDKKAIEKLVKEDPFHKYNLAEYSITEFNPSQKAKNIDELLMQ